MIEGGQLIRVSGQPNDQPVNSEPLRQANNIAFRIAAPEEYPRIEAVYVAWGYRGGVLPTDVVYLSEANGELIGIVRRTCEYGLVMLRGMYVAPQKRRRGIGSQLLARFVSDLDDVICFCVPLAHLQTFYGQGGFVPIPDQAAPEFLRDRMAKYRGDGLDVLVMRRP